MKQSDWGKFSMVGSCYRLAQSHGKYRKQSTISNLPILPKENNKFALNTQDKGQPTKSLHHMVDPSVKISPLIPGA